MPIIGAGSWKKKAWVGVKLQKQGKGGNGQNRGCPKLVSCQQPFSQPEAGPPSGVFKKSAVYVYTYELAYERGEGEGGDQLYQAMNRAMRLPDTAGIAYFRPLIWAIAQALAALPPYAGKLYRGIDCRFGVGTYHPGRPRPPPAASGWRRSSRRGPRGRCSSCTA
eukprot:EG_transcript_14330